MSVKKAHAKNTLLEINDDKSKKTTKLTKNDVTDYTKTVMEKVSKDTYADALKKLLGKRALDGKIKITGNEDKYEVALEAEKEI